MWCCGGGDGREGEGEGEELQLHGDDAGTNLELLLGIEGD